MFKLSMGNYSLQFGRGEEHKKPSMRELGSSGTSKWDGFLSEDYNSNLNGSNAITVYDKMRRGDAQVKKILLAGTLPILSAKWFVTPGTDDNRDIEIKDFVEDNLFSDMSITFNDFLRQALTYLPFGYSLFEKVYKIGDDNTIRIRKFAQRMQKSVHSWKCDKEGGYGGFIQNVDGKMITIPAQKSLRFTLDQEGNNFEGISLLRAAYRPWIINDVMYKVLNVGFEKQGLGILSGTVKGNVDPGDITDFKTALKRVQANEEAYLLLKEGIEASFLEGKIQGDKMLSYIRHNDEKIADCVLGGFLERGKEKSGGSHNLVETTSELFLKGVEVKAVQVQEVINNYAIKELVDYNFPNVEKYPKLDHSGILRFDEQKIADTLDKLKKAGVLTPDDNLEEYLRESMGLPEMRDEDRGQDRKVVQPVITTEDPKKKGIEAKEVKFREPLPTEKNVDFAEIETILDSKEEILIRDLSEIVRAQIIPEMKDQIVKIIRDRKIEKVVNITVPFEKTYQNKLKEIIVSCIKSGKQTVAREHEVDVRDMGFDDLDLYIQAKSKMIADLHYANLKGAASFSVSKIVERKQFAEIDDLYEFEDDIILKSDAQLKRTAVRTVPESFNKGRKFALLYLTENSIINGYQWSAQLDDRVCPLCLHLDGMTAREGDDTFYSWQPPMHGSCRCIWIGVNLAEDAFYWQKPAVGLITHYGEMI